MSKNTQAVSGGTEAYETQINALKNALNATPEFKRQLDAWMQQINAAKGETASQPAPGGKPTAPQQPSVAPPSDSGVNQPPVAGSSAKAAPIDQTGAPRPADAPASSHVLSGAHVPQALKDLAPAIKSASWATGVPEDQLAAMIWAESPGKAGASTTNGGNGMSDSGLMQINSATFGQLQADHPELQGKSVSDPAANIMASTYLMVDMKQQFGSPDLALRAYNSGPGRVDPSNANITTGLGDPDYVAKVNGIKDALNSGQVLPF